MDIVQRAYDELSCRNWNYSVEVKDGELVVLLRSQFEVRLTADQLEKKDFSNPDISPTLRADLESLTEDE